MHSHLQEHCIHPEYLPGVLGRKVEGVHLADGWGERRPTWTDASQTGRSSPSPAVLPGDVAGVADGQAEAHEGEAPGPS